MKKKSAQGFSFDFSALTFGNQTADWKEIPKLSVEPAAFENAERMVDSIDYNRDYFAFVSGNFVFGDFIEALCFRKRLTPSEVYITTLGMSKDNVDSIVNLVDYLGCGKVELLLSHYFAGVERHKLMPYIRQEFAGRPINVAVLQSHCKICLIGSSQGDVLISGSANLSSSNNVEQFILMHDPAVIKYVKGRLDSIMERFTVYQGLESRHSPQNNRKNTGKYAYRSIAGEG